VIRLRSGGNGGLESQSVDAMARVEGRGMARSEGRSRGKTQLEGNVGTGMLGQVMDEGVGGVLIVGDKGTGRRRLLSEGERLLSKSRDKGDGDGRESLREVGMYWQVTRSGSSSDEDGKSGGTSGVTGSRDRAWLHPVDRGKFWEPAHGLAYLLF